MNKQKSHTFIILKRYAFGVCLVSLFNDISKFVGYLMPMLPKEDGGARGVMVKAMDCGIVVSEFVLQSRYYVHFRTNTNEKGMNPLILLAIVPLLFF